ncbi:hypothetical protein JYU34_014616 [Plutella xylostella]|uniref:Uncharacterized protein n=1 Tax=Plutella xylostella TaxID=51655 RepID=A0ABQ7Q956_PLUXY|nr:hypothetical protein JYU34_014616 [Plutella xylostella]
MCDKNRESVANVCNLRPAVELIHSWEKTVSENTPENMEMVKFMQDEVEKGRARFAQNSTYSGSFHPTVQQVIANSSVFLYPHLLPPTPYRCEELKRQGYLKSEDELIVLGLDQFWQYLEQNKELFPRRIVKARGRWGLSRAVQLTCKYMMPWVTARSLMSHIQRLRQINDSGNAIVRYFKKHEIVPVKHRLLSYNEKLTLYDQPAAELPTIWLRYVAKTSKQARVYMRSRKYQSMKEPEGIDLDVQGLDSKPVKTKLPNDFTKKITCKRSNYEPKENNAPIIDIHINLPNTPIDQITTKSNKDIPASNQNPPKSNANVLKTVAILPKTQSQIALNTAPPLYSLVETTKGAFLMPVVSLIPSNGITNTSVTTMSQPISTPKVTEPVKSNVDKPKKENVVQKPTVVQVKVGKQKDEPVFLLEPLGSGEMQYSEHCKCCQLMRRIKSTRQKTILEYLKGTKESTPTCPCNTVQTPKITNRLRMLLRNFKSNYECAWQEMTTKLGEMKEKSNENKSQRCEDRLQSALCGGDEVKTNDVNDLAFAAKYIFKLLSRLSKSDKLRENVHNLFKKHDPDIEPTILLAQELRGTLDEGFKDLFKDFTAFLTAEQAEAMDVYKDYFVQNCVSPLIKKVEEQVPDPSQRLAILDKIHTVLSTDKQESCDICHEIMSCTTQHPRLSQYVFTLFPHTRKMRVLRSSQRIANGKAAEETQPITSERADDTQELDRSVADYEADHSDTGEEDDDDKDEDYIPDEEFTSSNKATSKKPDSKSCKQEQADDEIEINEEAIDCMEHETDERDKVESDKGKEEEVENVVVKIKEEKQDDPMDTEADVSISKTEASDDSSDMSMMVMSDDEPIKTEQLDWKKEEDKTILEILRDHISLIDRKDLASLLRRNDVLRILEYRLEKRSVLEIRERMKYLYELMINMK